MFKFNICMANPNFSWQVVVKQGVIGKCPKQNCQVLVLNYNANISEELFFNTFDMFCYTFFWDCNNGCASGYVDQCCQGRSVCFGWFDSSHQGSFRQENQRPFDEPSKRICEGKMLAAFALLILFNISLCFLCTHSALVNRK